MEHKEVRYIIKVFSLQWNRYYL